MGGSISVGRVGGWAFALGVGAAVLTGTASASADTGDSGSTTSQSTTAHAPRTHAGPRAADAAKRQRTTVKDRKAARRAAKDDAPATNRPVKPRKAAITTPATTTASAAADRTVVASGLNAPVDFQVLPDNRIVVAEKGGKIRIVEDGAVARRPLVRLPVLTQGERGINGITIDPDFADNGYLYVAYTTRGARDRLARLTVVGNRVAFGSQKVLLQTTDRSALYHRGGALGFGPDGDLYWGLGDNKNGANAQDLTSLHGKIIRLNPEGSIPSDNPDLGPGALPQIYAYGVRNPFRLTFTPTGELLVADVGENSYEELNLVTAGGNYGWPGAEGYCDGCTSIDPIYEYAHNGSGAAITSVLVYTGDVLGPEYQGKVFIADEVQGWIKVLTCSADFSSCGNAQDFDPQAGSSVVLRQAPDGSIYQLTYSPGQLVRISGAPSAVSSPAVDV
ncbi:glucose/sorbosone dehydrogenase [Mycolicibacterium chubuense NBB4]|uniref:Glucose/sorbosone dehydrogenase n=1 Tax=Mycolicibacterium chubuense (strain NBB4) TaxID=710421 RepID=I4BFS4_MYCCN|nr:PQQ-dependent sugar dehydrogenase [Mycolicibacterium chubuense]AFM16131.1 glucose/sorbosone dehydrogenase [Mycolicibacterium chubuense NBB4]